MIPGNTLQTEERSSGTHTDDGFALIQDAHQLHLSMSVELYSDDGYRSPVGLDERGHGAGHLDTLVDEQGIHRSRVAAVAGGRGVLTGSGEAGDRCES
jgi:hypothetical protein